MKTIPLAFMVTTSILLLGSAKANAATCELQIGAMGPLSGPAAQWGATIVADTVLAAEEANQNGGLQVGAQKCHVDVVSYDSKYTAAGGAAGGNYLISHGMKFIVGPIGTPEITGLRPIAVRNQVLVLADSFAKNAIGPQWPLIFHISSGPSYWADAVIKAARSKFKINSVVIVAPNDQGGTDTATVDAAAYQKEGVKVTSEYYDRGTMDFSPLVARILSAHPDAVETASSPPGDTGAIAKELRQAGFQGAIGHLGGPATKEITRAAGGLDVLENFYAYEAVPVGDPKVQQISAEYTKLTGKIPPENTSFWLWAGGTRMLLKAISKAGTISDTNKVAAALRGMPVEDPNLGKGEWTGQSVYGINQELAFPFGIELIVDGKDLGVQEINNAGS